MTEIIHIESDRSKTESFVHPDDVQSIVAGDWYWFKHKSDSFDRDEILCCVSTVGSNYAKIEHPVNCGWRVHFDEWNDVCRFEPNPQDWFDKWADSEKRSIALINSQIQDICARLGVDPTKKRIADKTPGSTSLAIASSAVDTGEYKTALIKAKDEDLPALFKQIKEHSGEMSRWLLAGTLSMKAKCGDMQETIGVINDRIFTVSIYAGLSEDVVLVRKGRPAGMGEKLRIMQGKLFMDEECLVNYTHGGMEFNNIGQFDKWLGKPENCNRILPYERCLVALQVRRYEKNRAGDGTLHTAWINFELAKMDTLTFLYIRNGERLYRLNTDIQFGHELFADRDEFNFTEPLMVNERAVRYSGSDESHQTITVRDYEERCERYKLDVAEHEKKEAEYKRQNKRFRAWEKKNPDADEEESGIAYEFRRQWGPEFRSGFGGFDPDHWSPLDDSNVYLDDVNDKIRKQANHYNRISALIQGLLDRSETLHPHPPVKLWTPQGFDAFVELIYDHDRTLYDGAEPPSWEEYKAACNATIGVGSVVTGQHEFWYASLPREVSRDSRGYGNGEHVPYRYTDGNPGPGVIAVVPEWSTRTKKATFRWVQTRYIYRRSRYEQSGDREYARSISVPVAELFNISGYKLGDYRQFFNDPRTRRNYVKWAHLLLTAEEYAAGNLDPVTFERKAEKR